MKSFPFSIKELDFEPKKIIIENGYLILGLDKFKRDYYPFYLNKMKALAFKHQKEITQEEIDTWANFFFDVNFQNAKNEMELCDYINKKHWVANVAYGSWDFFFKVDLYAYNKDKRYFIQLKPPSYRFRVWDSWQYVNLILFARQNNGTPILAIPRPNNKIKKYSFYEVVEIQDYPKLKLVNIKDPF